MRFVTSVAALGASVLLSLAVAASPALARAGCTAPQGTAATDQYCETVPSVEGPRDATFLPAVPLSGVLPKRLTEKLLQDKSILSDVLLGMPATPAAAGSAAVRAAARRAAADPRLDALRPGSGSDVISVVNATAGSGGIIEQGFAWTLVLTLLGIAGVSVWGSLRGWSVR